MRDLKIIKQELENIKKNKPSFLGIDGGNINSSVWVCGVEFGSDLGQMEGYYQKYVKTYRSGELSIPYREDCPKYFLNSTYDRFLAAMCLSFFNEDENVERLKPKIDSFVKTNLYNKNSDIFKLNLYPLAKKDTSWDKKIEQHLDIGKEDYYNSIFSNRKKFIKELTKKYSHKKVIICTSPKGYEGIFVETFFEPNQLVKYTYNHLTIDEKIFKISVFDDGTNKVIIIPFLGRGNLDSYSKVIKMTHYLTKEYIDDLPF